MDKKRIIYFSLIVLSIFLISTMCFSYAFFAYKTEGNGKLNIVVGTLDYKLESDDLENNSVVVEANSVKKMDVKLTSLNDIDSKYELFYTLENNVNGLVVGYSKYTKDLPSGIIEANKSKTITVVFKNTSSSNVTLNFDVKGGLSKQNLILTEGNGLALFSNICEYNVGKEFAYNYTGSSQTFTVPCEGNYKIELWGAAGGGDGTYIGGNGAYVSGNINLYIGNKLYVYVGEYGNSTTSTFNNGNSILYNSWKDYTGYLYAGGGSTDIRLVDGNWNDFTSIKSRIMVAGAGGGASSYFGLNNGGSAGGLVGYDGKIYCAGSCDGSVSSGAGQTYGGLNGLGANSNFDERNKFGKLTNDAMVVSGGNGYYAGGNGSHGGGTVGTGSGGSSFISGHSGCDAININSTENNIIHTGQSIHYSGYSFTDTVMIDGDGYNWTTVKGDNTGMPTYDGTSTMTGNLSNGYAKITYLGD